MNEKVKFDFEDRNYKSCFARSVAVNSQFKQTNKSGDFRQDVKQAKLEEGDVGEVLRKTTVSIPFSTPESQNVIRLRKSCRSSMEDSRRYSCGNINNTRRSSFCSSRIAEIPVENLLNQSKIETLQWQLKEIQKSREMYRAVMKQVVTFLEKAHQSLELLGSRMNRKHSIPRPKSEHLMIVENSLSFSESSTPKGQNKTEDYLTLKDYYWKQSKEEPSPDEIPPDKLAQEAFRLLRTAQSLLSTREPDLIQMQPETDIEFLAQVAKEFPSPIPEHKPQRATSFSLSPKLLLPESDIKISTAFNRKLSLQLSEVRRCSKIYRSPDSARGSVAESDTEFLNDASGGFSAQKTKSEKPNSPANESISSVEDESGFSSMNSFQEIGLPLVNTTMPEEITTKKSLLRSMIHNTDYTSLNVSLNHKAQTETCSTAGDVSQKKDFNQRYIEDIKLWQKPATVTTSTPQHKRWYSTPVEEKANPSLKVLWV